MNKDFEKCSDVPPTPTYTYIRYKQRHRSLATKNVATSQNSHHPY